jgi:hypothetical protein
MKKLFLHKLCIIPALLLIFAIAVCFASCDLIDLFNPDNTNTPPGAFTPPVNTNDPPDNPPIVPPGSSNQTPDGFFYSETASAVTIIGYDGTGKNITIPAEINGKPVTTIGDHALREQQLTGVTIPSSVTTIGICAFYGNRLTSLAIPSGVITIGNHAFRENQLTSVTIPSGVTTIGLCAFYGNRLTSLAIPSGVTAIGDHAFYENQLTSVTIPDSVTTIGICAFYGNQLTHVTIPSGITTIEEGSFALNKLVSVTIPHGVTTIGMAAFDENQLASVTLPDSVTTIRDGAFNDNLLTSLTIPPSVTYIGCAAFYWNWKLTSVTIGGNVTFDDEEWLAFIGDLSVVYRNNGRQAGTYTRPSEEITTWTLSGGGNLPGGNQTPTASDYIFGNLSQTANNVTAVTITAKSGKSPGAVSNIRYNNSTTIPQNAGTYPVTFDVAAAAGWNGAAGLPAGNLVVNAAVLVNCTHNGAEHLPGDASGPLPHGANCACTIVPGVVSDYASLPITNRENLPAAKFDPVVTHINQKILEWKVDGDIYLGRLVNNIVEIRVTSQGGNSIFNSTTRVITVRANDIEDVEYSFAMALYDAVNAVLGRHMGHDTGDIIRLAKTVPGTVWGAEA